MSVVVVGSAASNFPQTGEGRTRIRLVTDIAIASGGENDSDRQARALVALNRSLRTYNEVFWKCNRVSTDITFSASDFDYALPADFAAPIRVALLNTDGKLAGTGSLIYVDYPDWLDGDGDRTQTGDPPSYYTINNEHETGLIEFSPVPTANVATSNYPTARLFYYRRIVLPTSDDAKVNIPVELEGGVEGLAIAYYMGYIEGLPASVQPVAMELRHKEELEQRFRVYPENW